MRRALVLLFALAMTSCEERAPSQPPLPLPSSAAPMPPPAPRATPTDDDVIDDFPAGSVPLDQIKLRATSTGTRPTATIELPNGAKHVVKVGSMIGRSYGQVKEIREGEIVVGEETRDAEGRRHPRDVIVRVEAH